MLFRLLSPSSLVGGLEPFVAESCPKGGEPTANSTVAFQRPINGWRNLRVGRDKIHFHDYSRVHSIARAVCSTAVPPPAQGGRTTDVSRFQFPILRGFDVYGSSVLCPLLSVGIIKCGERTLLFVGAVFVLATLRYLFVLCEAPWLLLRITEKKMVKCFSDQTVMRIFQRNSMPCGRILPLKSVVVGNGSVSCSRSPVHVTRISMYTTCGLSSARRLSIPRLGVRRRFNLSKQLYPSLFSSAVPSASGRGDKLRVAVVGGGCAGLSAALHLAPLVEEGYIASPIDIYNASSSNGGRDIGVGVWTTALDPFGESPRDSHQAVYKELTQDPKVSTWLDYVGYRKPDGKWLMISKLPATWQDHMGRDFPGLLFLRERDLLHTLQKAVLWEQQLGTLKLHRSAHSSVVGVAHDEWWSQGQTKHPWSANLEVQLSPTATEKSERDYHLIVAADGTWSNLRSKYGGHDSASASAAAGGLVGGPSADVSSALSSSSQLWSEESHQRIVGLQDRNYTVFRGNAPITTDKLNELDPDARYDEYHRVSFQTWGTGKSMRFATVPMRYPPQQPASAKPGTSSGSKKSQEHQVWFITVNDNNIAHESDPHKRIDMLLEHFKDWHAPIHDIVRATDPNSVLMERAIAHRHCMGPVVNLNSILQKQYQLEAAEAAMDPSTGTASTSPELPYAGGPGPAIVFLGDAYMTIDPILAQGFTVAMEGSANLHDTLRKALVAPEAAPPPPLAFDPNGTLVSVVDNLCWETFHSCFFVFISTHLEHFAVVLLLELAIFAVLRDQLKIRHEARMDRLICLLRATELVQALGQPEGGSLLGFLNTHVLRPLTMMTPRSTKRALFDKVLKYSLGVS